MKFHHVFTFVLKIYFIQALKAIDEIKALQQSNNTTE